MFPFLNMFYIYMKGVKMVLKNLPKTKEEFEKLSAYEVSELNKQINKRCSEVLKQLEEDDGNISLEEMEELEVEQKSYSTFRSFAQEKTEEREASITEALNSNDILERGFNYHTNERSDKKMNENIEIRAFQKYLTTGFKGMTDEEQRALNQSGAAVVLPKEIANKLISNEKYSTLLTMATVFQDYRAGKLSIPIASNTVAAWKIENQSVDGETPAVSYEATPTLTNIELGGHELYRWSRISAAAHSMASGEFESMMLNLLGAEVIETLEAAFVKGSGSGQPKGLEVMTWVPDTNAIEATTSIGVEDIAAAISLLPARYAKNAVVMCNTATLADIALFKGTSEFAYNIADGAEKFFGHKIVVNEHVADDEIYIVDPAELYVRFALPLQIEANTSSGFTAAAIDLRALTVADAAWNPKAVVQVTIAAG